VGEKAHHLYFLKQDSSGLSKKKNSCNDNGCSSLRKKKEEREGGRDQHLILSKKEPNFEQ
jgi:hypothetical protein